MMELLYALWSYLFSVGGAGVAVVIIGVGIAMLMPDFRQAAIVVAVCAGCSTATYYYGRWDQHQYYKAKLEREIGRAVLKGDDARERTLRDFDASDDMPDDGFRRD